MEKRDISKDVVVVLLLLTVVVTLLGTWSVTNAASKIHFEDKSTTEHSIKTSGLVIVPESPTPQPANGEVGITILSPGDNQQ